jgi:bacillithiol system protein YtxJ
MWIHLTQNAQIEDIKKNSHHKPQLIFKHSTRCSISHLAKSRLDADVEKLQEKYDLYYLDLLQFRQLSNFVAEEFKEHHESPQALVIVAGECILNLTHTEISSRELL